MTEGQWFRFVKGIFHTIGQDLWVVLLGCSMTDPNLEPLLGWGIP